MSKLTTLLCLIWSLNAIGQQQISPSVQAIAGGSNIAAGMQLDWTLGEIATASYLNNSTSYTEGFHQPVLRVVALPFGTLPSDAPPTVETKLTVFPNPVTSELRVRSSSNQTLELRLTDLNGKILLRKQSDSGRNITTLYVADFVSGIYHLSCYDSNGLLLKSFRVIKH